MHSNPGPISVHLTCPHCGRTLSQATVGGLCLPCLLDAGLAAIAPDAVGVPSPSPALDTGTPGAPRYFGDYELLREIGRGGMGLVHEARQFGTQRTVALKLLAAGGLASRDAVHRFHTEAQAAARLEHDRIVPIYESGLHEGQYFLAMRFLAGGTLAQRLRQPNHSLTPKEAAQLVHSIAGAVHHAHQHGVLHRDLKPGNILLDLEGTPYVADFGLARVTEDESSLTRSHAVIGTATYMAPEVALGGTAQATTASDIYGLGAILFELLTGRPPFLAPSLPALLQKVSAEEPAAPGSVRKGLPRDLETICLKCLEKNPTRRYATARELAEELDRYLRNEPILARPTTPVERAWRWSRRKPALAASLFLLLVLGLGGPLAALSINEARRTAVAKEFDARRTQYASDMRLAQLAELNGDLPTVRRVLARHARPAPGQLDLRGWEWRYLWRQSQGSPRTLLGHHTNAVTRVGLLPGGRSAFSAGDDGVVKLYDLSARQLIGDLVHPDPVTAAAASPDGRWLVTLTHKPTHGRGDKPVVLWDLATRHEAAVLFTNTWTREGTLTISPDSKVFAFADQNDPEHLLVCELPTGRELAQFPARTDISDPQGLDFTPDGRTLVFSADERGTLVLVDTAQWREIGRLTGHRRNVSALAISADSRWIASVSGDRSLKLWDRSSQREVGTLQGLAAEGYSIAFSPDGTRLAVAIGANISIFSVPQLQPMAKLSTPSGGANFVVYASDREVLAGAQDGSVELFSFESEPDARDRADFDHGLAQCVAGTASTGPATFLSPDRSALLGVFTNGTFAIWRLPSLESSGERPLPVTNFSCAAISLRGETAAFVDLAGNIVLWRAADGQVTPFGREGTVGQSRAAFSPDGRRLALGGFGWHFVWDVPSRTQTHAFSSTNGDACLSLAFSPDSQSLAAGQYNGHVLVWPMKPTSTARPMTLRGHPEQVKSMAFADHGRTLISAGVDVRFWDLTTGNLLRVLRDLPGVVRQLALADDEKRLAVGYGEGGLSILDTVAGEELLRLKAFDWDLRHVGFCADGTNLFASSREQIRVWRAAPPNQAEPKQRAHPERQ